MRNVFFLITYFFSTLLYSQRILNFNVFSSNEGVVIKFTIAGGTYCSGFSVLHSIDSLNYYPVGQDFTPCAGIGNEEKTYTHTGAIENQVNYYKVELEPEIETSFPRSIYFTKGRNVNILVYPNPVYWYNEVTLKIFNTNNTRLQGYLYNQYGHPLRFLDFTTKKDLAALEVADLENGLYLLWLTDGSQAFSCKFIIKR